MKIAVTGAQGFIGAALCRALTAAGHQVSKWVRNPLAPEDKRFIMPDEIGAELFADKPDWVIHAAYVTQFKNAASTWEANLRGSLRLFELAEAQGTKILFLSSLSAHADALSIYGRSKFQLESALDLQRHVVVKPGMVVGPGGLFMRMIGLLRRLRFAVLFWGGNQPLYGVAIADLTEACLRLIGHNAVGRYHIMTPEVYTLKAFYTLLMQALAIKPRLLSLPGNVSLAVVQCLEKLQLFLPISSENLLGLKQAVVFESDVVKMGLSPMNLERAVNIALLKAKQSQDIDKNTGQ